MIPQPTFDIAQACALLGIENVLMSPGSRCAPLTIAFARHPTIKTWTISDERASAFTGMGMALASQKPVALLCTSGSAAYNFAPAISEAFFQHIPLIVFTADRPPEWIGQQDGQSMYQQGLYGPHVKASYQLPVVQDHPDAAWHISRTVAEAIGQSMQYPMGPVHINVPFREPFYPEPGQALAFSENHKSIQYHKGLVTQPQVALHKFAQAWGKAEKKLIVVGQGIKQRSLDVVLKKLMANQKVPVLGDIIANVHQVEEVIHRHDHFLTQKDGDLRQRLQPQLLVTIGESVISKNLKVYLRHYAPASHWHIQPSGICPDTYQCLTDAVLANPVSFLEAMSSVAPHDAITLQKQENFKTLWQVEERKAQRALSSFFPQPEFSEFEALCAVTHQIPDGAHLHLANSMAVRYGNFVGLTEKQQQVVVFANRGVSGIDGCNSTAVGTALQSGKPTYLLTGDMAFFYDRNAFWNNYLPPNLRIVVFNNHAGGIFRMINGPSALPELATYFETHQPLTAKHLAAEFGFEYFYCEHPRKFKNTLKAFFEPSDDKPKLLEIETQGAVNKEVLGRFRETLL